MLLVFCIPAIAQKKAAEEQLSIRFTVVDAAGEAVPGAVVTVGEGLGSYTADTEGRVSVNCSVRDIIRVSKGGYRDINIRAAVLVDSDSVVLVPDVLFAGDKDDIVLPYSTQKKRYSVGSTVTVSGDDLARYSSADIRNALTGVLPGVEVREYLYAYRYVSGGTTTCPPER